MVEEDKVENSFNIMQGTYLLGVYLKKDCLIEIGRFGKIPFKKGYYSYVGSALGKSINLENRLKRYEKLNKEKTGNLHWHIDYLLVQPYTKIIDIKIFKGKNRMECKISNMISVLSKFSIKGFGCSDCNCKSHLHYFGKNYPFIRK
ncbi:MAG: GIY-YIG nuclease family protein [Candidatus Aenigmatarchaeota archaeon]